VTVPRSSRRTCLVEPGRLSQAVPSGCGHPGPPWGPPCRHGGRARAFGGSHPRAGRPAVPVPAPTFRPRLPSSASPTPAGRRAPSAPPAVPSSPTRSHSTTSPFAEKESSPPTPPDRTGRDPSAAPQTRPAADLIVVPPAAPLESPSAADAAKELCRRPPRGRLRDRLGPVRASPRTRRCRLGCGCCRTPTFVNGGSRHARRVRLRRPVAEVGLRCPRRLP